MAILHAQSVGGRIDHDFDPRRAALLRRRKQSAKTRLQMEQRGYDVFASSEAVRAKINAITGELALAQIANLHRVSQAAARMDPEIGTDGMPRIEVRNGERFVAGAETALVDFIGIGGAPIVRRGNFDVGALPG